MEIIDLVRKILNGGIVIFRKTIKSQKFSGVIYLPKDYKGKKAIIIIENEDQTGNTPGTG